jgi:hypothetical protein
MSTLRGVGLGACLLGTLLLGCSRPGPPPPNLATDAPAPTSSTAPASADNADNADVKKGGKVKLANEAKKAKQIKGSSDQEAYKTAMNDCSADAQKKTMGSILAIFTRLRPGAYSTNYADCMKTHGIDVSK